MSADSGEAIEQVFRAEWGLVVATLIRATGDWDLAEECAQDAVAQALDRWPRDGVPRNPGAWLITTARNAARNRLRRRAIESAKLREIAMEPPAPQESEHESVVQDGCCIGSDDNAARWLPGRRAVGPSFSARS